jgi:hypothetical protein
MPTNLFMRLLQLLWVLLPFTAGSVIGDLARSGPTPGDTVFIVMCWLVWGAVVVATAVPHPISLTVIRLLGPVPLLVTSIALVMVGADWLGVVGLACTLGAAAAAISAPVADLCVDGASYGDERRFALRAPAAFLVGPIPVFWALSVGASVIGTLLLCRTKWIPGAICLQAAAATAKPAIAAFHGLARRWLVFVPAGVTIVDHLVLTDPALLPRSAIAGFGPALEGTTATDLTSAAPGLVLEFQLRHGVELGLRTSKDEGEIVVAERVLITPMRPGTVMTVAGERKLVTDRII